MASTGSDQILRLARRRELLSAADVREQGLTPQLLIKLHQSGKLQRVARGLYSLPGSQPTGHQSLVEICRRVPRGVICLLSALQYHEIGTQLPHEVWLALPEATQTPPIDYPPLRIVRLRGRAYADGIETFIELRISAHRGRPFQAIVDGVSADRGRCFRLIVDDVSALIVDDCGSARVILTAGIADRFLRSEPMPTTRITMRQIRQALRLHLRGRAELRPGRPCAGDLQGHGGQVRAARARRRRRLGAWPRRSSDEELEARLYRPAVPRSSRQLEPDFALHPPGAQAPGRHAAAAVGGVPPRQRAGLQVHELLRQVPRLGARPEALDAPDPHRRREAVRRLRRPDRAASSTRPPARSARADLRGRARRVELHLRLRHGDARPPPTGSARIIDALEFIGGVPRLIVPDQPRALITRPDRYDPERQPPGRGVLRPLRLAVLPARPAHPRDKPKVEVAVLVVERWILARLRNRRFFSLGELNARHRRAARSS